MTAALKQAELSFEALSDEERDEFIKFVQLRAGSTRPKLSHEDALAAWERMKQIGAEMAAKAPPGPSLMDVLTEMRNA